MGILSRDDDTISAVCTPPGVGGIAVLRISGSTALEVAKRVCPFLPDDIESHRVYYGFARGIEDGRDLDEVLATYFAAGRSFTGECTIEISCHGGLVVTDQLLEEIIRAGARLAERGEFSYRAFLNQRIDLVQAESILNLIEASSRRSSSLALRQLKGELSTFVNRLEDSIHWVLAHLEANIDFAAEDVESAPQARLVERLANELEAVERVLASYTEGRMLREGLTVAIVGPPNAGKSSLMNAMVGEERSIVTEVAGTTRDTIEGRLLVNGVQVTLVDTAGLHETVDRVEKIGIGRAKAAMAEADLVWLVLDLNDLAETRVDAAISELEPERLWLVGSKSDLVMGADATERLTSWWQSAGAAGEIPSREIKSFTVTTHQPDGVNSLFEELKRRTSAEFSENSAILTNGRHRELFEQVRTSLRAGLELALAEESPEFVAFELRSALMGVHELVGRRFDDDVLDRVFKEFCLGK